MGSIVLEPGQANPPAPQDLAPDSPVTEQSPGDGSALGRVESNISTLTDAKSDITASGNPEGPAPKTDKPRPHVCTTCGRSFARLEHLKRHERSHTKEKPFECPECTRCFARRDLLLRHQQKLHMTTTPSSRPKNGRRESAAALGPNGANKIRKGSMVGATGPLPGMRPRANTISHVDGGALGMFTAASSQHAANLQLNRGFNPGFSFQPGMNLSPPGQSVSHGPMHGNNHMLPRIATSNLANMDPHANLRTAPAGENFHGFDQMFSANGSTINPAQLHVGENNGHQSPFGNPFPLSAPIMEDEDNYDWMRGFNHQMTFAPTNDSALDGSSPSAISNGSPMPANQHFNPQGNEHMQHIWQQPGQMAPPQDMQNNGTPFGYEQHTGNFGDFGHVLSPANLQNHVDQMDGLYSHNQHPGSGSPHSHMHNGSQPMHQPMQFGSDITSISSASLNSSGRHSSITTLSTDSITDVTRQALIMSLSQPSAYGHRFSQPTVSSPLGPRDRACGSPSLPSTFDLQRYVNAYIRYFHPHFPFLHIPTLSFDSPAYTSHLRTTTSGQGYSSGNTVGGGGCLILAMSAIGALYENDRPASKELFDASKKMIQLYLEERRKADAVNSSNSPRAAGELVADNTPLWLVQAMLLNVIYGHQCGDKVANDIASTHCIALVSLARAAELVKPLNEVNYMLDVHMSDDNAWAGGDEAWRRWIGTEERKRTLFAIFHMSSLLVSAYNHAPALMNSEIQLDLPCDEDLWNADSAQAWAQKGGATAADQNSIPFAHALTTLLAASHHPPDQYGYGNNLNQQSELKPSTFGCLVLINALHNYIWETRQRHSGRRWTTQETEAMHAHIEPALRAWQSAWAANPMHSLERPNPFGMGPLSADSIPLLDLAYVRLFVNLGSSKEALWNRDFDVMAEELARGAEIVQHADYSEGTTGENSLNASRNSPEPGMDIKIPRTPTDDFNSLVSGNTNRPQSSKRERHLRKAALYAADSLSMSEKLGVTYADFTSRELPVQSAICAFDCAQVLAEWVATVQERVGRFLGILGRDSIDFTQVPAIVMLEDEDVRLLEKIHEIVQKAESKMHLEGVAISPSAAQALSQIKASNGGEGYGSKILLLTAFMLDRGAVWPVQSIMSQGLTVQAAHMSKRAEMSVNCH